MKVLLLQFTMYPRRIPQELWSMFQEIEKFKSSIKDTDPNKGNYS